MCLLLWNLFTLSATFSIDNFLCVLRRFFLLHIINTNLCCSFCGKPEQRKYQRESSLCWRMLFLCFPMYREGGKIAWDLIDHQHTPELCFYSKINFILMKISWKVYQHMCAPRISPFAVSSGDEFQFFHPKYVLFTHPRDIPSLPPFFRTTSVLYVQLT